MIKFENTEVTGWQAATRGMRNPMNSWDKSDSLFTNNKLVAEIGPNDHDLMMRLARAGSVDAKYRRMINVTVDITAPLYWWKEFDTYKVGTVANSCSTMHKIASKPFELSDFSYEHLLSYDKDSGTDENGKFKPYTNAFSPIDDRFAMDMEGTMSHSSVLYIYPLEHLKLIIESLNNCREYYNRTHDKVWWWQMIQLLPSSYNQKRTVQLNYEVLAGIYPKRKDHKLDEWHEFCHWICRLPYYELITLEEVWGRYKFDGDIVNK